VLNDKVIERLGRFDPRLMAVLAVALTLAIAAQFWILLLRQPVAAYMQKRATLEMLRHGVEAARAQAATPALLERQISEIEARVQPRERLLTPDQMVVRVVGDLNRIGKLHAVSISSVRPAESRAVLMFNEVVFEIAARGSYQSLYEWLRQVENEVGPLVVSQIELRPQQGSDMLALTLKLSAYNRLETGSAGK
jgi:Tfp pilus assembly protein PilO